MNHICYKCHKISDSFLTIDSCHIYCYGCKPEKRPSKYCSKCHEELLHKLECTTCGEPFCMYHLRSEYYYGNVLLFCENCTNQN